MDARMPNVAQPVPGVLTGGQPARDQLEEAAAAGYKTVVNLRTLSELFDGASLDEALELGRSAGLTRLETMTREYLSTEPN